MEKGSSAFKRDLTIKNIYCVLKEFMVEGRITPRNHKRHSDCLVCVYGGRATYRFTTHTIEVNAGDILYIAKGSTYYYDVSTPTYDYIYLDFDFDTRDCQTSESFRMDTCASAFHALFERMNNLWIVKSTGHYARCMSDLYQVYALIIAILDKPYANSAMRKLSEQAAVYIAQNCSDKTLNVAGVAKAAHCSEVHLRRSFKRDFNVSPGAYITSMRIEKAKSLLVNTDYQIRQISELVGFNDAYYFSRLFKELCGIAPTDYRRSEC